MDLPIHPALPIRRDMRIGVLGSGFIVRDCHLVAYRKAGFNPVAIASRNPENARKTAARHTIPNVYDTYEQLLDDRSIEVLDIAVPPNVQLSLILAACERKTVRGILAQKPLGMDFKEAVSRDYRDSRPTMPRPLLGQIRPPIWPLRASPRCFRPGS